MRGRWYDKMREEKYKINPELIDKRITKRLLLKKKVNLIISIIIAVLGLSTAYMAFIVEVGISSFRYLTVNGTLFTTVGSIVFIIANIYEFAKKKEITNVFVYYIRLSCAVTETVIMLVILITWIMGDTSGLNKWNLVVMHVVIPILTVASFIVNDAPIGKIPPFKRFYCTAFITVYIIIILSLFCSGILPMDMIPYTFIDWRTVPVLQIICFVTIVYLIAFIVATILYQLNKKLYWQWFRKLTK